MPSKYVHLSGRDIDNKYAELHGEKVEKESKSSSLAPLSCPRCEADNSPESNFCFRCGQAMNIKAQQELDKGGERVMKAFAELQDGDVMGMLKLTSKLCSLMEEDREVRERVEML
ncbi:zinc ribbon domain-containing protein [Methanonatronarchaeum sp. AMET-Sl]|uniref:zinc ribbon domain-containing protein n=1 Tax=Methanonatronarchaeum sp. AMET-Sl TaxID=3037654 RepID=UPI00244D9B48|nr:zinc ribbon domain-containing protein [Methanonatronarchaeum sp. AMET-Sl]WGI17762.1 zinc ribbon domain-containing protein [Methanonatronarchaeum sp. AMET-Sl]